MVGAAAIPASSGALEGVVVIELVQTLAGEFAGGVLADLGARVIKVEPCTGSPMRRRGLCLPTEESLYFQSENRGKFAVTAELDALATTPWFRNLLSVADALIEDIGPGGLESAGLAPDALQQYNPALAILRLSPFGHSGPLAGERGDDRIAQAFSGAQFLTGFTDRPPAPITVPMADCWSGIMGAGGLLMAVLCARRSGLGQQVDLALYEPILRTLGSQIVRFDRDGEIATRSGNIPPGVVPGNVFVTKDGGYVGLSGAGDKPFQRLCVAIDAPEAAQDPRFSTTAARRKHREEANALVADWISRHPLAEVEARFAAMGVAGAAVRSADQIAGDAQIEARSALVDLRSPTGVAFRAPGVVPKFSRTPAAPRNRAPRLGEHTALIDGIVATLRNQQQPRGAPRRHGAATGPLDGVRVLDISQVLAGPWAAGILADFGAEVIMVELPEPGAPTPRMQQGDGTGVLFTNRNKASVTLDVHRGDGKAAFLDLLRISDVLIENFRPGTLERWGLHEVLLAVNPAVVIVRASGFGQTGPYADRTSFNPVALAFGGVTYLGGWPDRPPLRDGITAGDFTTALFNVLGALAGLLRRDRDGLGQVADVAMGESCLRMTGDTIALKTALGVRQERAGGAWPVYPISLTLNAEDDAFVAVSAQSAEELAAVVTRLGIDAGATPDDAASALRAFVAARTALDAVSALRQAGAACSTVQSVGDLFANAHVWSRGNLVRVEDPDLGALVVPGVVPLFSRTPGRIAGWSRFRGSENATVLGGLLGYAPDHAALVTAAGPPAVAPAS